MALGIMGGIIAGSYTVPEITLRDLHPEGLPIWPFMFITVACGAISGFYAIQSPMIAKCIQSKKHGRKIFYGAMLSKSVIALVWAAGGMAFYGVTVDSFKMPENLPIAILTDEWTASSGEAVLLAFRGMENVRTFGAATAGYASVNMVYSLYDGAQLWLTVAADVCVRTGEVFSEDPVSPDVLTDEPEKEAAAWIADYHKYNY